MASVADIGESRARTGSTQFIVTLDRAEKLRWKTAADGAGLTMAEYVRRAVQQSVEAPTASEIAEAKVLAAAVDASVDRMAAMLDRTLARIDAVVDPTREAARREEILADIQQRGLVLDLDWLGRRGA